MHRRLPIELCEAVIDSLDKDDEVTLSACSLTCKAFVPASRRRLFSSVILRDSLTAQRFVENICCTNSSTNPVALIRHLSIDLDLEYVWFNEALPFLTKHLLEVTTLEFGGLRWYKLDGDARAMLLSGFQKAKSLMIFCCKFESSVEANQFISSFPSLTHLTFYATHMGTEWTSVVAAPRTPLPQGLQVINLDDQQSNFLDQLLILESHPEVHTVKFWSVKPHNASRAGKLLKTLGSSLEHLNLGDFDPWLGFDDVAATCENINLAHNPNLRTISLECRTGAIAILSQITSSHRVRVSLRLFNPGLSDLDAIDWVGIEDLFAQQRTAHFQDLTFKLVLPGDDDETRQAAAEFIKARLPVLESRGVLRLC